MNSKIRILIVEDQAIVVKDIENKLISLGYEVAAHTGSGNEAVLFASELKPDLVLMDIKLDGDLDGITTAMQIHDKLDIPIIYITAYSDEDTLKRARETHPIGYILKPFEERDIQTNIEIGYYKHKIEKKLSDEKENFRQLTENINEMLWICSADFKDVIYINPALEKTFNITIDQIKNSPELFAGFIHPEDLGQIKEHFNKLIKNLVPDDYSVSFRVIKPDGEIRWLSNKGFSIHDSANNLVRRAGLIQDVTESRELWRELKESEKKYKDILDQSLQGLVIVQGDPPKVVYLNYRIAEMLGYDYEALASSSQNPDKFVHPDDLYIIERMERRLKGEDVPPRSEFRLLHSDGSIRWMEVHAARIEYKESPAVQIVFVDISERKSAEEALKLSEERLRIALDAANEGIWEWNPQTSKTYYNPRWFTMLGYKPDELPHNYETWRLLLHPDDRDLAEMFVDEKIQVGSDFAFEFRMRAKDNKWIWIESRGRAVETDADGTITKLMGTHRDITSRKEAELALKESEARFRSLYENMSIGIYRTNPEGEILMANPALIKMLEFSSFEELAERNLQENGFSPLCSRQDFIDVIEKNGLVENNESVWITSKGRTLFVKESAHRIEDENNKTLYYEGTVVDITEKANAEKALRESEERFRRIIETAHAGYFRLDSGGKISSVNQAWLEMHGYQSEQEVIGKPYSIVHVSDEKEKAIEYNMKMLKGENIPGGEFKRVCKDGSIGYQTYSVKPVIKDGEIIGVEGFIIDTTAVKAAQEERKKLELSLLQIQRQESLGVLAGGIAHDFNNLLQSILGNSNLALMDLPGSSPVREYVKEIEKEAKRAANLTRQLLAYSGKGKFVTESVNLSQIIIDSEEILRISASKNISFNFNLKKDIPLINADPSQVRQVLFSLVTNSSEAIGEKANGKVKISTGVKYCNASYLENCCIKEDQAEGDFVFIEISDNGSGIAADMLDRIFDPFFSTKFTGRGLGLAAVLGIVQGHDGVLKVQSLAGKGTTMTVLFPALKQENVRARELAVDKAERKDAKNILIVDDEPSIIKLAVKILETEGYNVFKATDGAEAVELFRNNARKIRIVVLDLNMPNMDGEEAAGEILKIKNDTLILISSGFTDHEASEHFTGKNIAGFIQKPYRPKELIDKIEGLIA